MEKNIEFKLAEELLNNTGSNIFLTGKAGTGKTTFLKYFYENTTKNCIIAAPTGVAAINAGGVTLHSLFNLPFQAYIPSLMSVDNSIAFNTAEIRKHFKFNKNKRKLIQELDLLIIDEISMVRADLLDAINQALQFIRKKNTPFGGVQVLMIGDMFQLPPVIKQDDWNLLSQFYQSPYFFDAKVLENTNIVSVELKEIFRQSDTGFINLLNNLRNQEMEDEDFKLLHSRFQPNFTNPDKIITLTTHNKQSDAINTKNLEELSGEKFIYLAEIEGAFPENAYPISTDITLKVGAKVMFIKNDSSIDKKFYNGKIVEIVTLENDEIWVQFPEDSSPYKLEKEIWYNKKFSINDENDIEEEVLGSFTHYPIRLAWAITIHKSQGLTFDQVVIDAGKAFAPGQVYVALSRCTHLEGIFLQSQIQNSNLFSDEAILKFQKNIWNLEAINEILDKEKKPYAIEKISELVSLEKPLSLLRSWIITTHKKKYEHSQEISTIQVKIEKEMNALQKVAVKFKKILTQTYQEQPENEQIWKEIEERCKKAVHYFMEEYTQKIMKPFSNHLNDFENKTKHLPI